MKFSWTFYCINYYHHIDFISLSLLILIWFFSHDVLKNCNDWFNHVKLDRYKKSKKKTKKLGWQFDWLQCNVLSFCLSLRLSCLSPSSRTEKVKQSIPDARTLPQQRPGSPYPARSSFNSFFAHFHISVIHFNWLVFVIIFIFYLIL